MSDKLTEDWGWFVDIEEQHFSKNKRPYFFYTNHIIDTFNNDDNIVTKNTKYSLANIYNIYELSNTYKKNKLLLFYFSRICHAIIIIILSIYIYCVI